MALDRCGGRLGRSASLCPPSYPSQLPGNRQWAALPIAAGQVYPVEMSELPASYKNFLNDKDEMFVLTVKPVLQQSAADQLHGVRVTYNPGSTGHQAHIDESIPFGVVIEDID